MGGSHQAGRMRRTGSASSSTHLGSGPLEKFYVHSLIFSQLVGPVSKKIHTFFMSWGSDWAGQVAKSASGESPAYNLGTE